MSDQLAGFDFRQSDLTTCDKSSKNIGQAKSCLRYCFGDGGAGENTFIVAPHTRNTHTSFS